MSTAEEHGVDRGDDEDDDLMDERLQKQWKWLEQRKSKGLVTYIIYYHDESVIHKLEHSGRGWQSAEVRGFYPKSKGQGFNISDLISAWDGYLADDEGKKARMIHRIGGDENRNEMYWNNVNWVDQMEDAIESFNRRFKLYTNYDKYSVRPCFIFDNAGCHKVRIDNALNASKMNLNPGI